MKKLVVVVTSTVALATLSACTLLLPTEELIVPCVADEDCAEGFECLENACLPLDEGADSSDDSTSG